MQKGEDDASLCNSDRHMYGVGRPGALHPATRAGLPDPSLRKTAMQITETCSIPVELIDYCERDGVGGRRHRGQDQGTPGVWCGVGGREADAKRAGVAPALFR